MENRPGTAMNPCTVKPAEGSIDPTRAKGVLQVNESTEGWATSPEAQCLVKDINLLISTPPESPLTVVKLRLDNWADSLQNKPFKELGHAACQGDGPMVGRVSARALFPEWDDAGLLPCPWYAAV